MPSTLTRNEYVALNACEFSFAFHCYFSTSGQAYKPSSKRCLPQS